MDYFLERNFKVRSIAGDGINVIKRKTTTKSIGDRIDMKGLSALSDSFYDRNGIDGIELCCRWRDGRQ
jgi:hypothetical protein